MLDAPYMLEVLGQAANPAWPVNLKTIPTTDEHFSWQGWQVLGHGADKPLVLVYS